MAEASAVPVWPLAVIDTLQDAPSGDGGRSGHALSVSGARRLLRLTGVTQLLDGLLFLPPHRRANPWFKPGELPRIALALMKEAGGPVSVRYLAGRALAQKGCPYPTPGVMRQTRRRPSSMLTAWGKRGLVVKVGSWNASRHALVRSEEVDQNQLEQ